MFHKSLSYWRKKYFMIFLFGCFKKYKLYMCHYSYGKYMEEIRVNSCKLVLISKFSPLFWINRDFGSLANPSTPPCIDPLLRAIKNHINFYILTLSNYMFNDSMIQFVVFLWIHKNTFVTPIDCAFPLYFVFNSKIMW
jgi:hypothetical protein